MLFVAEFISELQARKGRDLLVFACSGSKRSDEQIEGLSVKVYPSQVLPLCEDYRRCVARSHRAVTDPSSLEFAACLRYSGVFYQQIPLELWQELLGWPVLILSAYYGLIRPTDGIRHYDLSMNRVPKSCKRLLPSSLSEYMVQEGLERALLLTSGTYAEPFSDVKGAYIVEFHEGGRKVSGVFGKDHYRMAGLLVTSLLEGSLHIRPSVEVSVRRA